MNEEQLNQNWTPDQDPADPNANVPDSNPQDPQDVQTEESTQNQPKQWELPPGSQPQTPYQQPGAYYQRPPQPQNPYQQQPGSYQAPPAYSAYQQNNAYRPPQYPPYQQPNPNQPVSNPYVYPSNPLPVGDKSKDGLAIAGFVLGLLSILTCTGAILGIPSIILSAFGLKSTHKNLATAGLVTAIIGTVLITVILIVYILTLIDAASYYSWSY